MDLRRSAEKSSSARAAARECGGNDAARAVTADGVPIPGLFACRGAVCPAAAGDGSDTGWVADRDLAAVSAVWLSPSADHAAPAGVAVPHLALVVDPGLGIAPTQTATATLGDRHPDPGSRQSEPCWSYDIVHDRLADGRTLRLFVRSGRAHTREGNACRSRPAGPSAPPMSCWFCRD